MKTILKTLQITCTMMKKSYRTISMKIIMMIHSAQLIMKMIPVLCQTMKMTLMMRKTMKMTPMIRKTMKRTPLIWKSMKMALMVSMKTNLKTTIGDCFKESTWKALWVGSTSRDRLPLIRMIPTLMKDNQK